MNSNISSTNVSMHATVRGPAARRARLGVTVLPDLRIFVLAATLLGTGCVVRTNLPANRLETPEAHGETLAFAVNLGAQGSNALDFAEDFGFEPIHPPTYARSNVDAKLGGSIGLTQRLDLGVKLVWDAPAMLQVKYQLLGDSKRVARKGNFSVAMTGAVGTYRSSGSEGGFFGENDSYSLSSTVLDGALIAGRRVSDRVLLYGGPFIQRYDVDVSQELDGTTYRQDAIAYQYGANLGLGYTMIRRRGVGIDLLVELVLTGSESGSAETTAAFLGAHVAVVRF